MTVSRQEMSKTRMKKVNLKCGTAGAQSILFLFIKVDKCFAGVLLSCETTHTWSIFGSHKTYFVVLYFKHSFWGEEGPCFGK